MGRNTSYFETRSKKLMTVGVDGVGKVTANLAGGAGKGIVINMATANTDDVDFEQHHGGKRPTSPLVGGMRVHGGPLKRATDAAGTADRHLNTSTTTTTTTAATTTASKHFTTSYSDRSLLVLSGAKIRGGGVLLKTLYLARNDPYILRWIPMPSNGTVGDEGKVEGPGKLICKNGTVYDGHFIGGALEGVGRIGFRNGNEYRGHCVGGLMDGEGVYTWDNGDSYSGSWKKGMKEGWGVFTWMNGEKHEGNWKDDVPNGQGKRINREGKVIQEGIWEGWDWMAKR